jgi:hypothetical protein
MTASPDRLLRMSLLGNAAFSTLSGLTSIFFAARLEAALGIPEPFSLMSLGVQLLLFAGLLVWLATREVIRPGLALAVVIADVLWVVGTVPLLLAGVLTTAGFWTAAMVADVVGVFAVLQLVGLRRLRAAGAHAQA